MNLPCIAQAVYFTTLLICLPLFANGQWTAKNLGGRSMPVYRDAGDLVTFAFPLPNQRVSRKFNFPPCWFCG